jgi:SAM-dependent methyltransferase
VRAVEQAALFRHIGLRRLVARELMDDPVESLAELTENLRDIERVNRWLGGTAPVAQAVFGTAAATVLDVGCGSADIPLALVRRAERTGRALSVTCLDHSAQMLAIARERTGAHPRLSFVEADGASLPFADRAFDIVTCNLALHHFEPDAAVRLLDEMRRVARLTPLVCDLRRSRAGYLGALAFAYATTRNRLTRHDAPLSVLRSYTPDEAADLARRAGWRAPTVGRTPFFRMMLRDAG